MPNSENVTTKFRVDISDLKKNIAEANRQLKTAQAEFKNATAGMQKGEKTVDSLSAQIKAQEKAVESEKAKLSALKAELERYTANVTKGSQVIADLTAKHDAAAREYGEESEQAKKLAKQLDEARAAQERNKTAVENLNTQIINQDTKLKAASSALKEYDSELAKAQSASGQLSSKIKNQQTELQTLKDKYKNVALTQGTASTEARELAAKIKNLSTELQDNKKKLNDSEQAADRFDRSLEEVGDAADKTTQGGLGAFSVALGNLASNVITKVIDGLGKMVDKAKESFEEFDKGRDAVIKATGATGEQAKEITKSYGEVAKRVPAELEKIGETVGEVNTRFGLTGEELEKCSEDFLKFADIAGVDAKTAVQNVSRAMAGAGIETEKYSTLLDKLAVASQASGVSTDTLTANLTKYGAQMRALGFDTDETIAMFAQWEKAGVNTETALAGMKKAVGEWSKEGKDAKKMFAETVNEIANFPDKTKATQKAVEEFGSKAGPELADAIRSGRFQYSDLIDTITNSEGAVSDTFEETQSALDRIQLKSQQLRTTAGEMVGKLLEKYEPQITVLLDKVSSFIDGAAPKIETFITKLEENLPAIETDIAAIIAAVVGFKAVTIIQGIIGALGGLVTVIQAVGVQQAITNGIMAANPIGLIVAGIAALIAIIVVAYKKVDWFRNFVDKYFFQGWKDFANWGTDIMTNKIPKAFTDFLAWFTAGWSQFANGFTNKIHDLWENIKKGASAIPEFFKEKFTQAYTNIKSAFSGIGSFFGGIWSTVKGKFRDIGTKVGEVIGGAFKAAINAVLAKIENGLNFIPNAINGALHLINQLPNVNIPALPTFELPRLMAKGGIVTRATNAIVGEGGENEAVIPLRTGIPKIAAALARELGTQTAAPPSVANTYNFYQTNNSPKALSRWEIYRQTRNQLRFAKGF